MKTVAAAAVLACIVTQVFAQSQENNGVQRRPHGPPTTDQIIVKWRGEDSARTAAARSSKLQSLSSSVGTRLQSKQRITGDTEVLKVDQQLDAASMQEILRQLAADPQVEYAVADERRWAHAVPNDPLFVTQWYFVGAEAAATHADQAWDVTVGSSSTIVAVLDTGVRYDHPDLSRISLGGKLLDGFDFVSNVAVANDGNGPDADATDPGDWVNSADISQPSFSGCELSDSSWHGTRVSSLIAAITNNAGGMAGTGWNTLVLPVRVLGKCGGNDSDIIAGMRWAAGLSVFGAPANPTPAKIINLSLGGDGVCSAAYQSAVSEIVAQGVVIVVSVGNDGSSVSTPANCSGVIGVTGLRHAGTKVGFSNLGLDAALGAPGGNCVNTAPGAPCLFSITAASNNGTTTPSQSTYTDQFNINVGTSFSAPLVAGAAALMHAVNTRLSPDQYRIILRETAATFPTGSSTTATVCHIPTGPGDLQTQECICTTSTCGAGMLNTTAAVLAAQRPFAIAQAPGSITSGTNVSIDARTSFASDNRTIATYLWSAVSVTGAAPVFADASQPLTTFQVSGDSQFTLRLTVTDSAGSQDTADVAVATPTAPTPPPTTPPASPPAPGGGGGGGGSMGLLMLGLSALAALSTSRRSAWRRARQDTR